ncbi:MAG: DUF3592 domain-containing protein [Pseudomonadota bacterium]
MILIIALVFAGVGVALIVEHFRFMARAASYQGEVVEVKEQKSYSSSATNPSSGRSVILYLPVWEITLADGRKERISSTIGSSDMNFPIGTRHKVLVDPKHPGTGRMASAKPWFWAAMCFAAAGFLVFADHIDLFH